MTGNFAFGEFTRPALVAIQDDVGITFDSTNLVEKFKNILAGQTILINGKFKSIQRSYKQGLIILTNMRQITMIDVAEQTVQQRAIEKRFLGKYDLKERANLNLPEVFDAPLYWFKQMWLYVFTTIIDLIRTRSIDSITSVELNDPVGFIPVQ